MRGGQERAPRGSEVRAPRAPGCVRPGVPGWCPGLPPRPRRAPPGRSVPSPPRWPTPPRVGDPVSVRGGDHVDPLPVRMTAAAFAPGPVHREPPGRPDGGPRLGPHVGQRLRAAGLPDTGAHTGPRGAGAGDQSGCGELFQEAVRTVGRDPGDDGSAPRGEPQSAGSRQEPPLLRVQPSQRYADGQRGLASAARDAPVRRGQRFEGARAPVRGDGDPGLPQPSDDLGGQRRSRVVRQVLHPPGAGLPRRVQEGFGGGQRGAGASGAGTRRTASPGPTRSRPPPAPTASRVRSAPRASTSPRPSSSANRKRPRAPSRRHSRRGGRPARSARAGRRPPPARRARRAGTRPRCVRVHDVRTAAARPRPAGPPAPYRSPVRGRAAARFRGR